jgi:hypothetical protein
MKPRLPVGCRLRLWIVDYFEAHKLYILSILLSVLLALAVSKKYNAYKYGQKRVSELVDSVFHVLAEQAALHRRDPLTPATVIVDQLRDAMFLKSREDAHLWPQVCLAVTANSNVREQSQQCHGRYAVAWEWIGMDILGGASGGVGRVASSSGLGVRQQRVNVASGATGNLYPSLNNI